MLQLIWLVPVLPFIGFLLLTLLSGSHVSRRVLAVIGVMSVAVSAIVAILLSVNYLVAPPPGNAYVYTYWTWLRVGDFAPRIALHLDALSLVMMLVVTFVGALIHLYSAEYMAEEDHWNYGRFFSYLNLFVAMMLVLVLADNLLLLYLGWEGVGLCSYLLIGFWYQDPANGRAARKAFIVTRIGDAALVVGLFLLFDQLGTLDIQPLLQRAMTEWPVGSTAAVAAALLLLGGAVGKSAQLPLQIWLPDAMAGPTPVSALIHAATMVTAGVYLIARTYSLFLLAPLALKMVAIIGALTLLMAGFSALTQWDIKRVLAYSTMSQVGYMFLALGVGAWSAAIFHLMVHAFFKALLFLGAGVVISRLGDEHNMFKMGGLRRQLPLTFWTFLIGASALAALPLVTAGFYSKDKILADVWASSSGGFWLWAAGLTGAFLTGLYAFRMVFLTFFGEPKPLVKEMSPLPAPGWRIKVPLVTLAALSIVGGFIQTPPTLGNITLLSDFLQRVFPPFAGESLSTGLQLTLQLVAAIAALGGVALAYLFFLRRQQVTERLVQTPVGGALHRFWFAGWGFDWLDNEIIVRPFVLLARMDKDDWVDLVPTGAAKVSMLASEALGRTQDGRIRRYVAAVVFGAVLVLAALLAASYA